MRVMVPTLIKADEPTPNNNVYPKKLLEEIVVDVNKRISDGELVPVRDPIESKSINDLKGSIKGLSIGSDDVLSADIELLHDKEKELFKAVDRLSCSMGCSSLEDDIVLNTMVELDKEEDSTKREDGIMDVHRAKFVAASIIRRKDSLK